MRRRRGKVLVSDFEAKASSSTPASNPLSLAWLMLRKVATIPNSASVALSVLLEQKGVLFSNTSTNQLI